MTAAFAIGSGHTASLASAVIDAALSVLSAQARFLAIYVGDPPQLPELEPPDLMYDAANHLAQRGPAAAANNRFGFVLFQFDDFVLPRLNDLVHNVDTEIGVRLRQKLGYIMLEIRSTVPGHMLCSGVGGQKRNPPAAYYASNLCAVRRRDARFSARTSSSQLGALLRFGHRQLPRHLAQELSGHDVNGV